MLRSNHKGQGPGQQGFPFVEHNRCDDLESKLAGGKLRPEVTVERWTPSFPGTSKPTRQLQQSRSILTRTAVMDAAFRTLRVPGRNDGTTRCPTTNPCPIAPASGRRG